MNLQTFLRESTWGYPIIGAAHVLALAWFGGTVLVSTFEGDLGRMRRIGLVFVLLTGALLFWLHPAQYYSSAFFRLKMLLLLLVPLTRPASRLSLALWLAIIFAARGVAFF